MATRTARVLSVNVGSVREFEYNGRPAKSAIWKSPVVGRIAARGINLDGDEQADRKAHGGPDKVIYAYAVEDTRWWKQEIDRPLGYGEFGENLTTEGIGVNDALIGERWEIGTTILEVSEPRIPCWRLGITTRAGSTLERNLRKKCSCRIERERACGLARWLVSGGTEELECPVRIPSPPESPQDHA